MSALHTSGVKAITAALSLYFLSGCASFTAKQEFNPKTCMEQIPAEVSGLQIINGNRSKNSLAQDMRTAYCNGQMLLMHLNQNGEKIDGGTVNFQVVVEYNGEVISARVVDTDITSEFFLERVSNFIVDTDFTAWQRSDDDTVFIYPLVFHRWWE